MAERKDIDSSGEAYRQRSYGIYGAKFRRSNGKKTGSMGKVLFQALEQTFATLERPSATLEQTSAALEQTNPDRMIRDV